VAAAQLNQSLAAADGSPTAAARTMDRLDTALVFVFAAELAVNAYAHWLTPFLRNGWVGAPVRGQTVGTANGHGPGGHAGAEWR
jgi:hypothetical protein